LKGVRNTQKEIEPETIGITQKLGLLHWKIEGNMGRGKDSWSGMRESTHKNGGDEKAIYHLGSPREESISLARDSSGDYPVVKSLPRKKKKTKKKMSSGKRIWLKVRKRIRAQGRDVRFRET